MFVGDETQNGRGVGLPVQLRQWQALILLAVAIVVAAFAVTVAPFHTVIVLCVPFAIVPSLKHLRPFAISALLILSLCEIYIDVGGRTVRLETLFIFVLLGAVVSQIAVGRRKLDPSPIYKPLFIFAGFLVFSSLVGMSQAVSSEFKLVAFVNMVRLVLAYLAFVVVYNFKAKPETKLAAIINATILFSFVSCGLALLQIAHHKGLLPFGLPELLTKSKAEANMELGREIFGPFVGQTGAHMFAVMLSMQTLAVFCYGLTTRSTLKKVLCACYVGLMILILVRISVRAPLFGMFAGCAVVLALEHKGLGRKVFAVAAVGCCGLLILYYLATHQFETYWLRRIQYSIPLVSSRGIEWRWGNTMTGRFEYWSIAWQMIKQNPILGVGINMYEPLTAHYTNKPLIPHPHNGLIHVITELGIVGTIAFTWLAVACIRELLKMWRKSNKSLLVATADMLLLGMVINHIVINLPATTSLFPKPVLFFMAVFAARLSLNNEETVRREASCVADD